MPETIAALLQQAHQARRERRPADAHRSMLEVVALSRSAGTRRELIDALKGLGQIERDLGRGEAARPLYEEAVALCRAEADPLLLAHTVRHLGDIHQDAGRLTLAEPCYHEALALYRADPGTPKLDLANAVRPLALLKEAGGNRDEARKLWAEAKSLYEATHVSAGVDECAAHLADLDRAKPRT
ncbi:MAG: tetratricopeptide repeat protein [Planctomycetota bacterium]|nr:tetratricopeptide repeat protein [Planctomycetota bacterium]